MSLTSHICGAHGVWSSKNIEKKLVLRVICCVSSVWGWTSQCFGQSVKYGKKKLMLSLAHFGIPKTWMEMYACSLQKTFLSFSSIYFFWWLVIFFWWWANYLLLSPDCEQLWLSTVGYFVSKIKWWVLRVVASFGHKKQKIWFNSSSLSNVERVTWEWWRSSCDWSAIVSRFWNRYVHDCLMPFGLSCFYAVFFPLW